MNELIMELDTSSMCPLYEQIYNFIRDDIQSGKITAREKLPSTRSLSKYLQVSRSTVDLAYDQLLSEGYIESVPCKGYYVCDITGLHPANSSIDMIPPANRGAFSITKLTSKSNSQSTVKENPSQNTHMKIDFLPGAIDLSRFPFNTWRKITKDILIDDRKELFQMGDPRGDEPLRRAIRDYLYQSRGVSCSTEQIVIGAGNDYLEMLLSYIMGTGYLIAMENPTYRRAYRMFEGLGYSMIVVDMDKDGMNVDRLRASQADIAYVMPSHQYPLGTVMPLGRRLELLSWAYEQENRFIIEDDYDSEFRYVGKPIPALQGYDEKGKVIYMGTLSNSIAPAIRVSYMVLPMRLLESYETYAKHISCTVSRIDQTVLEEFIREGHFARHLNRMRALYKAKHDILVEELRKMSDICTVSGELAGVHILVHFTNGMSEKEILSKAASKGVKLYGLSESYIRPMKGSSGATILMGYANLTEEEIREGIRLLKEAVYEA